MSTGAIEALTAAVEANTAALKEILAAKATAGATATKPGATATKPGATASAAKPGTTTKATGPTLTDIQEAFGGYLGITDKPERLARMAKVKTIVDYFGVPKATDLKPENYVEALGYLKTYIDGGTPEFADASGGEEEESLV